LLFKTLGSGEEAFKPPALFLDHGGWRLVGEVTGQKGL
jgi:hypothetical protein